MVIEIPARLPSWNVLYSGVNHHVRTALKNKWRLLVRASLPHDATPFATPVIITVTAEYKGTSADPDNLCAKLVIDGLKGFVLHDDDPSCVAEVRLRVLPKTKRDHVTVQVEPAS